MEQLCMAEDIETTLQYHWATRHVDFDNILLARLKFFVQIIFVQN